MDPKIILTLTKDEAEGQEVTFMVTPTFDDPGVWGMLLVDIAHHVARAYEAGWKDITKEEILERIKEIFDKEWDDPSDPHQGNLLI